MTENRIFRHVLLCSVNLIGFQAAQAQTVDQPDTDKVVAPDVAASDAASDIVVTAQRRAERLQDVPITITSLSADTMRQANIIQLADIAKVTSGVRFDSRYSYFTPTIRGISTSNYLPGSPSNVALYLDGFYSAALASSNFQLMNIDNIQVLKGPQGTLFGRNTTAGAVLINTAKPSTETRVIAEASYGSYNAQRYQVYATTGLSDRIAVDIAGQISKGDGWVKNIFTNDSNAGKYHSYSVRAGVNIEASDNLSLLFRYERAHRDDPTGSLLNAYILNGRVACVNCARPGAVVATKRGEISEDERLSFIHDSNAYQLTANLDMGFANLTSYTQYRTDNSEQFYSLDLTSVAVNSLSTKEKNKLFTQELLVNSKPGTRLQWTAGAFYSWWSSQWPYVGRAPVGVVGAPSPYPQFLESGIKSESYAVFGDATYEVVDNLFLTAGLRYTHDALKDAYSNFFAIGPKFPPTLTTTRLTPRGVIRYQFNNASSIYASVSKGYKAAIYNISSTVTPGLPVLPEEIWAYEVGYKYADRDLSFNVSGYYYDYTNQQLAKSTVFNNVPQILLTNAASSELYGIDADIRYQFGDHFSANIGANWSHARYKDFQGAPSFDLATFLATGTFVTQLIDASGLHMTRAPDFTANAGAAYTTDIGGGTFVLSGNMYYTSKFYFDLVQQVPHKSYATLDLRVEWTDPSDRYTLAVAGKNVTDTHYVNQASQNALGIGTIWGAPATVEASVRVKF